MDLKLFIVWRWSPKNIFNLRKKVHVFLDRPFSNNITYIQHTRPNRTDYLATFCFQFCYLDVVNVSDEDVFSTVPAVYLLFVLLKVTIMDRQRFYSQV